MGTSESKTSPRKARGREREIRALDLRISGMNYRNIAQQLDISESGAYKAVIRALKRLNEQIMERADEVRRMELDRLDKMLRGLWPAALKGNQGAVDRVVKIMDRRARYIPGLNTPDQIEVRDWREEAQEAGFDPAAAFERLVQEAVETVTVAAGDEQPDGGSVAGSEVASEGTT